MKKEIDINKVRENIKKIDEKIAILFEKRMNEVKNIAKYKKDRGLKVFDANQESKVIKRNLDNVKDDILKTYYKEIIESYISVSKDYQEYLNNGERVTFAGEFGAFSHIATKKIFDDATIIPSNSFSEAYELVESGKMDACVLPIENSYAGGVVSVADLLYSGKLYINAIYTVRIAHNLLGVKGSKLKDIKTVYSHEQAINQCKKYIDKMKFKIKYESNTSVAAKKVKEMNNKSCAAIASIEAKDLFNLELLANDINTETDNYTRFAVLTRVPDKDITNDNFLFIFTIDNDVQSGALSKVLKIIGKYNVNIKSLRSRPMGKGQFKYYFYVEAEGNAYDPKIFKMKKELLKVCSFLKFLGGYKTYNV